MATAASMYGAAENARRWWGENPTPQSLRRGQPVGLEHEDVGRAKA
jgi:hypothetical protein